MALIFHDEEGRVTLIHHKPWLLSTEKQEEGVSVDYALVPPPNMKRGFSYVHYIDPETKEQWYEEEERPFTQEELLEIQNEKMDELLGIVDILIGGESDE